jgi:hypothetical protein
LRQARLRLAAMPPSGHVPNHPLPYNQGKYFTSGTLLTIISTPRNVK